MIELYKMAYRNLNRNRRRSILSALAVSIGLALLLLITSVLAGEIQGALNDSIRLVSGHLQVRAVSYAQEKTSLKGEGLLANPDQLAAQIKTLPGVTVATPTLCASGILSNSDNA